MMFPPYCSGSAFILNPEVAKKSLQSFKEDNSFFWIDDVFLTGWLMVIYFRSFEYSTYYQLVFKK